MPTVAAHATQPWILPLANAGNVTMIGADDGPVELDVPVPAGLSTAALSGTLKGSAGSPVTLRVTAGDKAASLLVDKDGAFDMKLPSLTGEVGLTVEVVASGASVCAGVGGGEPPNVTDLNVQFDGVPAVPLRVGAFFPKVLDRVTIVAPTNGAGGSASATLGAAAAVVRRYKAHIPMIEVTTKRPGAGASPFERTIEIRPGGDAGFKIDDGVLLITGADASLSLAASRLDDPRLSLGTEAWLAVAVVEKVAEAQALGASFTLKDAAPHGFSARDQRRARVNIVLEQSLFTSSFDRLDLDLSGRVQLLGGSGPVVLTTRLNGDIVHRSVPTEVGAFEVNVAGRNLIQEPRAVVTVEAQLVAAQACTPGAISLEIDARSSGTASSVGRVTNGFAAMATAWNSKPIDVTVRNDVANLNVAAALAVSMQSTTSRTLRFNAFAWDGGDVIVAGPALTTEVIAQADKEAWPLGSAAFVANTSGNRLVVVRSTSADAVRSVLDSFSRRGRGWADVAGDVLVVDRSGAQSVGWLHAPTPRSVTTAGSGGFREHVLRLFGLGVAAVVVAVFLLELARRIRRTRRDRVT